MEFHNERSYIAQKLRHLVEKRENFSFGAEIGIKIMSCFLKFFHPFHAVFSDFRHLKGKALFNL